MTRTRRTFFRNCGDTAFCVSAAILRWLWKGECQQTAASQEIGQIVGLVLFGHKQVRTKAYWPVAQLLGFRVGTGVL